MGSSRTDWAHTPIGANLPIPDVKAWRLLIAAAAACDIAMYEGSHNYSQVDNVGQRLFYTYVAPYCQKHVRKFDNMGWEPWKAKLRSKYVDNPELREALNEILSIRLPRRTHEAVFYTHVPSLVLGRVYSRGEKSAAYRLNNYKEPLYVQYEGTRYHVTAALDGVSMHLEPYSDDRTAYELAELIAYHPHLANYL